MGSYINTQDGEWYEGIGDPGAPWRDLQSIQGIRSYATGADYGQVWETCWVFDASEDGPVLRYVTGYVFPWDIRTSSGGFVYKASDSVVQQSLAKLSDYLLRKFAWDWQGSYADRVDGAKKFLALQIQSGGSIEQVWSQVQGTYGPEAADVAFRNVGLNPPGNLWVPLHGFAQIIPKLPDGFPSGSSGISGGKPILSVAITNAWWS